MGFGGSGSGFRVPGFGFRVEGEGETSVCAGSGRLRVKGLEMCSGSEAGSYVRLIDFVYHSTLGLRVGFRGHPCLQREGGEAAGRGG